MKNNVLYVDFIFSHKKVSYIKYKLTSIFYFIFINLKDYLSLKNRINTKPLHKKDLYKVSNNLKLW